MILMGFLPISPPDAPDWRCRARLREVTQTCYTPVAAI
jgi:hypothetical protein